MRAETITYDPNELAETPAEGELSYDSDELSEELPASSEPND